MSRSSTNSSRSNAKRCKSPDYQIINKSNVQAASLLNRLRKTDNINELTTIAGKIIDLEQTVLRERQAVCKRLQAQQKRIQNQIDSLRRALERKTTQLNIVKNKLDLRLVNYKKILETKINVLSGEYNKALERINAELSD